MIRHKWKDGTCVKCGIKKVERYVKGRVEVKYFSKDEDPLDVRPECTESVNFGLERRYYVKKLQDSKGKHTNCDFFVLDPKHDIASRAALRTYAENTPYKELSKQLLEWLKEFER